MKITISFLFNVGASPRLSFEKETNIECLPIGTIFKPHNDDCSIYGTVLPYSYYEQDNELIMNVEGSIEVDSIPHVKEIMEKAGYK